MSKKIVKKKICGRPQPRPAHRWSWPDLPRALRVKFSWHFFVVSSFGPSLVRDMPWSRPRISRSIFFLVHRGFRVVCDYWSGKRRDPIATANSIKSIVESSWFLKKVDWGIETFHLSKFSPATGVTHRNLRLEAGKKSGLPTPVGGSNFRPLSQTQNLRNEFRFFISPDFGLFFK